MKMQFVLLLAVLLMAVAPPTLAQPAPGGESGGSGRAAVQPAAPAPLPIPPDLLLVHLDTPALPSLKSVSARLDLRVFGGDEDTTYVGLSAQYGFGDGWSGALRASFAGRKNLLVSGGSTGGYIRHGGGDIELMAKYQPRNTDRVVGLIGIAFPDTSAQNDPVLTLGVAAAAPVGSGVTAYINPRTVLVKDNTLFGLGIGLRARVAETVSVVADWTPLLSGQNTRRTDNGARKRDNVYGIAVRFARPDSAVAADLGFATGTGSTTGFALTPGLGGSGAFFAALTYRR